jgi:Fic family protein
MRREDLCHVLKRQYKHGLACGVCKVNDPGYRNLWFVVPPPPPTTLKELPLKALAGANRVLNKLTAFDDMSALDQTIAYLFGRREAVTSSRMEGTWSTIDYVLTPEGLLEQDKSGFATASVRGYAKALEDAARKVVKGRYKALTKQLVCRMHKAITEFDPTFRYAPGKLRRSGELGAIVQIGSLGRKEDSVYNPPPADQVERCLSDVMSWYQDDLLAEAGDAGIGLWLPVRMAVGHSHFEGVHPFPDGNGRVGRMLWPLQMILAGLAPLYLSGYVEVAKKDYGLALQSAQKQLRYGPIIEFICQAIESSFQEAEATRKSLLELPAIWRGRAKFRSGSAAERAIELLISSPILSAGELAKLLDVPFESASKALATLASRGVVKERTGYLRNRIFAAEEVIAILSRPFGSDVADAMALAGLALKG